MWRNITDFQGKIILPEDKLLWEESRIEIQVQREKGVIQNFL